MLILVQMCLVHGLPAVVELCLIWCQIVWQQAQTVTNGCSIEHTKYGVSELVNIQRC